MARCDMGDFMAQNERQFGFVVHQRHKLASDIDKATGDGESVVDVRIEQRDGVIVRAGRQPRLHGDPLADTANICRLRTFVLAAELRDQLRVCGSTLPPVIFRQAGSLRRRGSGKKKREEKEIAHGCCSRWKLLNEC